MAAQAGDVCLHQHFSHAAASKKTPGALIERLRHNKSQNHSWSDSIKYVWSSVAERRAQIENTEPSGVQQCLETLQKVITVKSQQNLKERLDLIGRHLGLNTQMQEQRVSLGTDTFQVDVLLGNSGLITNVRLANQGDVMECPDLKEILQKGNFSEFIEHLQGIQSIYQVTADKKLKSKAFVALQALEKDLKQLAQFQSSISGVANYIHKCPLGIMLPRLAGKPMKLIYFVSPYDMLDKKSLAAHPLTVQAITENLLGQSVNVCIEPIPESAPANKLQTMPLMNVNKTQDGKSLPSFSAVSKINSMMLPASFVLVLAESIPVSTQILYKITSQTGLEAHTEAECRSLRSLIVGTFSGGDIKEDGRLVVSLPDQQHIYFLECLDGGCQQHQGMMVSRIPFTHPTHVPQILNLLRQQLLFNIIVGSCVRPGVKPECGNSVVFELTAISLQQLTIVFEHPAYDSMIRVDIDLADITSLKCRVSCPNSDQVLCSDEAISKVFHRCMSIPIMLRWLIGKGLGQLDKLKEVALAAEREQQEKEQFLKELKQQQAKFQPTTVHTNRPPPQPPHPPPLPPPPSYPHYHPPVHIADSVINSMPLASAEARDILGDLCHMTDNNSQHVIDRLSLATDSQHVSDRLSLATDSQHVSDRLSLATDSQHVRHSVLLPLLHEQQPARASKQQEVHDAPMLSRLLDDNTSVATTVIPMDCKPSLMTCVKRSRKRKPLSDYSAPSPKHHLPDGDLTERFGPLGASMALDMVPGVIDHHLHNSPPVIRSMTPTYSSSGHQADQAVPNGSASQNNVIDLTEDSCLGQSSLKRLSDLSMLFSETEAQSRIPNILHNSPSGSKNENASTSLEGYLKGSGEVGRAKDFDPSDASSGHSNSTVCKLSSLLSGNPSPGLSTSPHKVNWVVLTSQAGTDELGHVGTRKSPSNTSGQDFQPSPASLATRAGCQISKMEVINDRKSITGLFDKFDICKPQKHVKTAAVRSEVREGKVSLRLKVGPLKQQNSMKPLVKCYKSVDQAALRGKSNNMGTFDFKSDEDDDAPLVHLSSDRFVYSSSPTCLQISSRHKHFTNLASIHHKSDKVKKKDKSSGNTTKRKRDKDKSKREKKKKKSQHFIEDYMYRTVENDAKADFKMKIRVKPVTDKSAVLSDGKLASYEITKKPLVSSAVKLLASHEQDKGAHVVSEVSKEQDKGAHIVSEVSKEQDKGAHAISEVSKEQDKDVHAFSEIGKEQDKGAHIISEVSKEQDKGAHIISEVSKEQDKGAHLVSEVCKEQDKGAHAFSEVGKEQDSVSESHKAMPGRSALLLHKSSPKMTSCKLSPFAVTGAKTDPKLVTKATIRLQPLTMPNSSSTVNISKSASGTSVAHKTECGNSACVGALLLDKRLAIHHSLERRGSASNLMDRPSLTQSSSVSVSSAGTTPAPSAPAPATPTNSAHLSLSSILPNAPTVSKIASLPRIPKLSSSCSNSSISRTSSLGTVSESGPISAGTKANNSYTMGLAGRSFPGTTASARASKSSATSNNGSRPMTPGNPSSGTACSTFNTNRLGLAHRLLVNCKQTGLPRPSLGHQAGFSVAGAHRHSASSTNNKPITDSTGSCCSTHKTYSSAAKPSISSPLVAGHFMGHKCNAASVHPDGTHKYVSPHTHVSASSVSLSTSPNTGAGTRSPSINSCARSPSLTSAGQSATVPAASRSPNISNNSVMCTTSPSTGRAAVWHRHVATSSSVHKSIVKTHHSSTAHTQAAGSIKPSATDTATKANHSAINSLHPGDTCSLAAASPVTNIPGQLCPSTQSASIPGQLCPSTQSASIPGQLCPSTQSASIPGELCPSTESASIPGELCPSMESASIPGELCPSTQSASIPGELCPSTQSASIPAQLCPSTQSASIPGELCPSMESASIPGELCPSTQSASIPGELCPSMESASIPGELCPSTQSASIPGQLCPSTESASLHKLSVVQPLAIPVFSFPSSSSSSSSVTTSSSLISVTLLKANTVDVAESSRHSQLSAAATVDASQLLPWDKVSSSPTAGTAQGTDATRNRFHSCSSRGRKSSLSAIVDKLKHSAVGSSLPSPGLVPPFSESLTSKMSESGCSVGEGKSSVHLSVTQERRLSSQPPVDVESGGESASRHIFEGNHRQVVCADMNAGSADQACLTAPATDGVRNSSTVSSEIISGQGHNVETSHVPRLADVSATPESADLGLDGSRLKHLVPLKAPLLQQTSVSSQQASLIASGHTHAASPFQLVQSPSVANSALTWPRDGNQGLQLAASKPPGECPGEERSREQILMTSLEADIDSRLGEAREHDVTLCARVELNCCQPLSSPLSDISSPASHLVIEDDQATHKHKFSGRLHKTQSLNSSSSQGMLENNDHVSLTSCPRTSTPPPTSARCPSLAKYPLCASSSRESESPCPIDDDLMNVALGLGS